MAFARELVSYMERHRCLNELVQAIKDARGADALDTAAGPATTPSTLANNDGLSFSLEQLLERTYELVNYTRSQFDSAPLAVGSYPGHVEHDKPFCEDREQLKDDIKKFLDANCERFEYERFVDRLERSTTRPAVSWKRSARCGCWWNARDELREIANYLEELRISLLR